MSAHSAGAYTATLLVMVNVRQKAAVATLCTLWVRQSKYKRETWIFFVVHFDLKVLSVNIDLDVHKILWLHLHTITTLTFSVDKHNNKVIINDYA